MRDLDQYSKLYQGLHFEHSMVSLRKKLLIERIAQNKPMEILEVGCALDPLFMHISDLVKVTTIEPTEEFFMDAQKKVKQKANVTIHNCTLEDFETQQSFDFIVASGVLHEVSNPDLFLERLLHLATSTTTIHINVPNASSFHRQLALEMGLIEDIQAISDNQKLMQQTQKFYTIDTLEAALVNSGFTIVDSGGYLIKPFTHAQMTSFIESQYLTQDMLNGLYEMGKKLPKLAAEIWVECKRGS